MENSKLYSTQGIEQLKQKIEGYKDTLTSLKMGNSIEDYLFMKMDFDEIKTQMALLEELNETIDDKQKNSQIRGYEEQIKLLSAQIESLNQTIEEMNRDILKVLNKLLTIENTEAPTTPPKTEKISNFFANGAQKDSIITQTTSPSTNTSKQPSYKMLQNLAGKATNTQLDGNNGTPSTRNGNQKDVPEERHFNQQYFQSINTHPSQIYNGLYRNTNTESTFHFKHATNIQEIPVSINGPALAPDDASTPENYRKKNTAVTVAEMNAAITNEPSNLEVLETVIEPVIPEATENVLEPVIPEAESVIEPIVPEVAENVIEPPVVPEVEENVIEPVIPEVDENVIEPVIPGVAENVIEPVIPEVDENVIEPVIPEATEMVIEPVVLGTDKVVNEQVDANKSPILKGDLCEIVEPTLGEVYETHTQIEEVNESPEESQKKEKGSLFFNFFRKWS
ncbi:hypothetical protein C7Y47_09825 [Lysinibacillus sphaericus]|uniref:Uncharacterized protein n=1 Tax=Lysinibacillus sphaericus TaxID=1421 RepID=A0A544ULC9_LYSSH|nr:hypothetical protein [Lysinibacillus sp. SDF0037]TQR34266.1 hypothetical protein C7Y47_09825 [Lysinibacillus sp. SDF0037]